MTLRPDLKLLAELVPDGSRVLDLGCGDGQLLSYLTSHNSCTGTGVERESTAVLKAISAGVPVIELDLDTQLDEFGDNSYDIVILSRTLQAVRQPREVLEEMARIGSTSIVSMPNFGYWRNRLRLLSGRVPMSKDLPYAWFDSPNLRFATLTDLEPLFTAAGLKVMRRVPLDEQGRKLGFGLGWANLLAGSALYVLSAAEPPESGPHFVQD